MTTYIMQLVFNPRTGKLAYGEIVPKNSPKLDSRVTSQLRTSEYKGLNPCVPFKFFNYGGGDCLSYDYFVIKMTASEKKQINKSIKSGMSYDDILHLVLAIEIEKMTFPDYDQYQEKSEILTDEFYAYLGGE